MDDYDEAIKVVRLALLGLPRYSFFLLDGGVRRVPDDSGRWIDRDDAAALLDSYDC